MKKMTLSFVAAGNPTLLVYSLSQRNKKTIIKSNLGRTAEQIGFVTQLGKSFQLEMMGGELCVNGCLSLASQLKTGDTILTSGLVQPIKIFNRRASTTIVLNLPYTVYGNIVLLPGIGFLRTNRKIVRSKALLSSLIDKYKLPAFGLLRYDFNKIQPEIFVKETNSLIKETACGSGSIAFSILTRYVKITQPTGETISVNQNGQIFSVTANVTNYQIQ